MLELRDLGFAYRRADWVFRGVSLTVAPGTATSVLGPNGRGKTTLVRCAAGLLPPVEGQVRRAAPAAFVPQAHGSVFAYRVLDMVLMGRARQVGPFSVPGAADHAAARDAIDRVGIGELATREFPTLSGGEQQLVLIARAVASGSPLLVLDEPATGLDLHNQGRVLRLLRSLVAEGLAVLLTTHHPDHALHVSDSVVLMGAPDDIRCGPARDLLTEAELSALYGVAVRGVTYEHDGEQHRSLVTHYDVAGQPLSPAPLGDRTPPRRR